MTIEFTPVATVLDWSLQDWLDKYGTEGVVTMLVRYMEGKARMKENQAKRSHTQKALVSAIKQIASERGMTVDQLLNSRVVMGERAE